MKLRLISKRTAAIILTATMMFGMAGCSNKTTSSAPSKVPTVTIWSNGGQEVRDGLQAMADKFNANPKYNKKAHIQIQFVVSGTNEQSLPDRLAAAYKAGKKDTDFDIIATDDSAIAGILAQTSKDFFQPIDTSKIPNYKNVMFKQNLIGNTFIPYRGTAVYLAYNSDKVPNPPKTSEELYQWIKDHPGRFAYNDPTTGNAGFSFVANTIYNNLPKEAATSSDEKWMNNYTDVWNNAFKLMADLHPYLHKLSGKVQYPIKNAGSLDLLINQQIDMTPAFVNMVLSDKNMGTLPKSIKLTQLKEPFLGGLAGFLIPSISSHKEEALTVIDGLLSNEAQAADWNAMYAFPVVDSKKLTGLKNSDWLKETDFNSIRYFSIGLLQKKIGVMWTEKIGAMAK